MEICICKRARGLRFSSSGAQLKAPVAHSVSHEYVGFILVWPIPMYCTKSYKVCHTFYISGEDHELTVMWREFNPSTSQSQNF